MNEFVIYIFSGAAVLLLLAVLWYLIQTVRIMWAYNSLLAIAAVVFSPFVHIFFYFMPKDEFDKREAGLFKKYFLSIGLFALLGVVAAATIPATSSSEDMNVDILSDTDINEIKVLANQRDADAQLTLAREYYSGKNLPQDDSKALHWTKKSAEQGNVEAQVLLGLAYDIGNKVDQDDTEAAKWYQKAAEQGDSTAQSFLGSMYEDGRGIRQDYTEAAKWYQKAADYGNDHAQFRLGVMYQEGKGVRQNYAEAINFYQKAAIQGNEKAQLLLGVMYQSGKGVRQDYVEAKEWFGKACDNGLQVGCDYYRDLN